MRHHQPVFLRQLFIVCFFLATFCVRAQTTHSLGIGAFVNAPFASGNYSLTKDEKFVVRASPFIDYALTIGRVNASVGVGDWNSTLSSDLTLYSGFNGNGFDPAGTLTYSFNYAFMPLSLGVNVINGEHFKIGAEAYGLLKYLVLVNVDVKSDDPNLAIPVTHYNGSELDQMHFNKFNMAAGGGLFIANQFGRVLPKIGVGYLTDFTDVYDGGLVNYRFSHVYAAVSLNYVIAYREKLAKSDHRVKW